MTTLAKDTPRRYELGDMNDLPMVQSDTIYEGAAVGDNGSGYFRPLVAGDPFAGFCVQKAVNAVATDGAENVRVKTKGEIILTITSVAVTDIGKAVYATDDNAFTLTPGNIGAASFIGRIKRVHGTNLASVAFDAQRGGFGHIDALTLASGYTADGNTVIAVSGVDGTSVASAINVIASKVNRVIQMLDGD